MNAIDLLDALGTVDDELLQKARTPRKSRKALWLSVGSLAACLCIAVGAAAINAALTAPDSLTENHIPTTETTGMEFTEEHIMDSADSNGCFNSGSVSSSADSSAGTSGQGNTVTPTSAPFVMIEIIAWAENGFDGFVPNDADSDLLDAGSAAEVVFLENIRFAMPMDAYGNYMEAELNASNSGAGTVVKVQFDQMETQADGSVILYANAVFSTTIPNTRN